MDILGISELKWTKMGEFNSDDHYIYYCGQEFLRRNGVAFIVKKRVWNAVLQCSLKNDKMISVRFPGKPFNITVIQHYAPTTNAEEAEVEWLFEDFQDLQELTPKKKRCPFHHGGLKWKSRKSRDQFSSVTKLYPTLCNPMDCSMPGYLSITNSQSLLKLMSIESVMPSNHLILDHPLFLLP